MDITEAVAAAVAAECIAAIEWQASFVRNPNSDDIPAGDMIAAVTPKHPATLRIIEAMKRGATHRAMKEFLPPGAPKFGIVLLPTTCRSIAGNLAEWGFRHEAEQIMATLDQSDLERRTVIRNRKRDSLAGPNHDSPWPEVDHGQALFLGSARADHRVH
jgi:hypothetical protein